MIYSVLYANNVQTVCTAIWENSQVGSLAKEKGGSQKKNPDKNKKNNTAANRN